MSAKRLHGIVQIFRDKRYLTKFLKNYKSILRVKKCYNEIIVCCSDQVMYLEVKCHFGACSRNPVYHGVIW